MIKKLSTLFLIVLMAQMGTAFAQDWQMDKAQSTFTFNLTAQGSAIGGGFKDFDAQITLDPENTSGASIKAVIKVGSIFSDNEQAVSTGLSSKWLGAANFPELTFKSTGVTKTADKTYQVEGELAVKDIKKPYSFPFTLNVSGNKAHATAQFNINRATFNIGDAGDAGPEIRVTLSIHATKK